MTEPIEGKLIWQGEEKNRKRLLSWKNKQGDMTIPNRFPDNQLAAELRDIQESAIDVHLELENGQPRRIRPAGQEWKEPARTVQAAPVRNVEHNAPQNQRDNRHGDNRPRQFDDQVRKEMTNRIRNLPLAFHNPYNFIPAVLRKDVDGNINDLGDREPSGHDRYCEKLLSGKLSVKMSVETPLLLMDTAKVEVTDDDNNFAKKDHKLFPVRVKWEKDIEGKTIEIPDINPTAIKGMLRSAYEAVTNSRLSVFKDHDNRLAFRGEPKIPVPARIESYKGGLAIRLMDYGIIGKAAKLERYEKNSSDRDKGASKKALKYEASNKFPEHGEPVWVEITKRKAGFDVTRIKLRKEGESASGNWREGWVCVTGANISGKRFERVFLPSNKDRFIPITKDEKDPYQSAWNELIKNYKEIHESDLKKREKDNDKPSDYLGDDPGKTAWSRHIFTENEEDLSEGTLCYAILENNSVKGLIPVMISRRLYNIAPVKLLPTELSPAYKTREFSSADRVFGWVRQRDNEKHKTLIDKEKKLVAYRGQIRIGAINCISNKADAIENFTQSIPLQILGQPKPQQGRFYVAESKNGEAQIEKRSNEDSGFNTGRGLRGRKVYPHHNVPEDYWKPTESNTSLNKDGKDYFQEYLRPKGEKQRDSQNRSVKGWVNPATVFEFDIHFINLSDVELGALLWLLQLEPTQFHRFGGGKPLGFGSVHLSLNGPEICNGENVKKRYESFDEVELQFVEAQSCINKFKEAIEEAYGKPFEQVLFIKAFLKASSGFDKPVHYPRTSKDPKPEGESFEWFVTNNKIERGSVKYGFVLPNLWDDEGLPILPQK